MAKTKVNTDTIRLMLAGLVVGFVVALPMGAHALVNNNGEPVVQREEQEPEQSPAPSPETTPLPTPDPIISPEPSPVTSPTPLPEVTEQNETPVIEPAPVTELQVAIAIASAEHPNFEVISAKVKRLGAEKVYKITFADGWRIYVSADDGEVYVIKDGANKKHAFHQYAKKQWMKKYGSWKPWSSKYKSHCKHWVESQNWNTDTNDQQTSALSETNKTDTASFPRSNDRKKDSRRSSDSHHQNQ